MNKHANGTWYSDDYEVLCGRNAKLIADCGFSDNPDDLEELANARLIAAAPELLEALEDANNRLIGQYGINHPMIKRNRELIAKANGGA